jgi:hypothetical protein
MTALQKDSELNGEHALHSRFTDEQSRPNGVSIMSEDATGAIGGPGGRGGGLAGKLERAGFNVLQCRTRAEMRRRKADHETAGFLV